METWGCRVKTSVDSGGFAALQHRNYKIQHQEGPPPSFTSPRLWTDSLGKTSSNIPLDCKVFITFLLLKLILKLDRVILQGLDRGELRRNLARQ